MSEKRKYWSDLRNASWLCVATNMAAATVLVVILNRGLQTNPDLHDRIQFLAQHNILWLLGWVILTAESLSLLYFFFCFSRAHEIEDHSKFGILKFAICLVIGGVVLDIAAHITEMLVLPDLAYHIDARASAVPFMLEQFHVVSRLATGLVCLGANSLYTLATALACWSTRKFYPEAITIAGISACVIGLLLSVSSLLDFATGLFLANALMVPALLFWQGGIAVVANRHAREHLV